MTSCEKRQYLEDLYIPPCRTNIWNFSIRFQVPTFLELILNSLSPEIQNSESIRLFGKRLENFLLS